MPDTKEGSRVLWRSEVGVSVGTMVARAVVGGSANAAEEAAGMVLDGEGGGEHIDSPTSAATSCE